MPTIKKDLEEKLGSEKVDEILEKEWKVVEPPTAEELAVQEQRHPKARNNVNSRKNLAQYKQRSKEAKEKALENLVVSEYEEDVDPKDIFGDDKVDLAMLDKIFPAREILANRKEQNIYYNILRLFLKDFDLKELSSSDIHDLMTLALNAVIECRLVKAAKGEKMMLEASPTLEKLRRHSGEIKKNLASRRVDRIDTKNRPIFSIVELAAHLDSQNKLDFDRRMLELEGKRADYVSPLRDAEGNLIEDNGPTN